MGNPTLLMIMKDCNHQVYRWSLHSTSCSKKEFSAIATLTTSICSAGLGWSSLRQSSHQAWYLWSSPNRNLYFIICYMVIYIYNRIYYNIYIIQDFPALPIWWKCPALLSCARLRKISNSAGGSSCGWSQVDWDQEMTTKVYRSMVIIWINGVMNGVINSD